MEDVRSEWQHVESESAPRFSALRLLQPDENGLSRVIAELLRSNGRHGQGKVFLDLFLDQIGHKELAAGSREATVRIEEFASGAPEGGRIDITVRIRAFCVAIENKPWAGDQPSQLRRYAKHLRTRCEDDFCLVYVNKRGDPPPSDSIPEAERDELERAGHFKILSYAGEFKCWLQACRDAARPENVRSLIDSLSSYLDEEGPLTRKEKDEILEHVFEDPKRLRIALLVGATFQDLCQRLFKERADELEQRLRARLGPDWEFRTDSPSGRFSFCLRKSAWPKPMEFGFRRDSERGPFYLWLRKWNAPEQGAIDERLNGKLRAVIGAGGPWESLSWWRSVDDDHNWSRIDVLQELATSGNEPVTYVADHLELMARTLEPIIEQEILTRSAAASGAQ